MAALPTLPEVMGTPSTITSTWSLSVPRTKSEAAWPGPPLRPISRPVRKRSRSARSVATLFSISSRVTISMLAGISAGFTG